MTNPPQSIDKLPIIVYNYKCLQNDRRYITKDLIKAIRFAINMNQEQFASALGTTPLSINRWERGNRKPQARAIDKLIIWCKNNGMDLSDVEDSYDGNET